MEQAHDTEYSDTITDERRRILSDNACFPKELLSVFTKEIDYFGIGIRCRNDLQQFQVAWWIKEVRPTEVLLEIIASSFGHVLDRDPGSIGGYQSSLSTMFFKFFKNLVA